MKDTRPVTHDSDGYVLRIHPSPAEIDAAAWDALLALQDHASPFARHAYLQALHDSGSAVPESGWTPAFVALWHDGVLQAACPLYLKSHSYGEYVFDWAWANAYAQHGLDYYPKAVSAIPYTPVPGARLLARDARSRSLLVQGLLQWCEAESLSSLHLLFASDADVDACREHGLMLRHTVQFHWTNVAPAVAVAGETGMASRPVSAGAGTDAAATTGTDAGATAAPGVAAKALVNTMRQATAASDAPPATDETHAAITPYRDFDHFLASLVQEKRKKIRQERRKVAEAGVVFRWARGADIAQADWDFFYRCYERTYLEHGNAPYLTRDFFQRMQDTMPEHWLLFVAERDGVPMAASLIALSHAAAGAPSGADTERVAYGRYWGALERVDCLHFEACYYQPIAWCIAHGIERFEGGAQGEHKMARALMPVSTTSAHWLARPDFSDAVERFLEREGEGIAGYMEHLEARSPFRHE